MYNMKPKNSRNPLSDNLQELVASLNEDLGAAGGEGSAVEHSCCQSCRSARSCGFVQRKLWSGFFRQKQFPILAWPFASHSLSTPFLVGCSNSNQTLRLYMVSFGMFVLFCDWLPLVHRPRASLGPDVVEPGSGGASFGELGYCRVQPGNSSAHRLVPAAATVPGDCFCSVGWNLGRTFPQTGCASSICGEGVLAFADHIGRVQVVMGIA